MYKVLRESQEKIINTTYNYMMKIIVNTLLSQF